MTISLLDERDSSITPVAKRDDGSVYMVAALETLAGRTLSATASVSASYVVCHIHCRPVDALPSLGT